jgi:hypothetical protein
VAHCSNPSVLLPLYLSLMVVPVSTTQTHFSFLYKKFENVGIA